MSQADVDEVKKMTKIFLNSGIKVAKNDEEADEVHWAQDPEKVHKQLEEENSETAPKDQ